MGNPKSVFVSYARRDKEAARSLIDELRRSGFSVLGDPEELQTAKDWQKATENAIKSADAVIVLIGGEVAPSKYQELEWSCTLESYWADRTKSLIPVLIGDAALPSFLSRFQALHLPDAASGWNAVIQALQSQGGEPIPKTQDMAQLRERLQSVEDFAESLKKE
jgi:hypothetical protein